MKEMLMIAVLAMAAMSMAAQTPAAQSEPQNAEATVNVDSGENQAISQVQGTDTTAVPAPVQQVQPQAQPAPEQKQVSMTVPLFIMLFMLIVAMVSLSMAKKARADAKKASLDAQESIYNLKSAVKERMDALEAAQKDLEARLQAIQQQPVSPVAMPQRKTAAPAHAATPQPKRIFLTPPDEQGRFGNASATFERGNSIFVLTTADGNRGTYTVINDVSVHRLALMMPTENLTRACTGQNIQVSHGAQRIVTDKPGTAVLRGGRWTVDQPAQIHYEA